MDGLVGTLPDRYSGTLPISRQAMSAMITLGTDPSPSVHHDPEGNQGVNGPAAGRAISSIFRRQAQQQKIAMMGL